uniref:Ensconsin n=2 Tax=Schistocephalus solidus TaxID=70667 RepID=A0A0X3P9S9_SCHSO
MAQERRKELERQHQEHLQGLLERTRERTASVSETRSRLDHPDLNGGMPATMRTSQTLPSSSRPESSNRMCTSYTVAFGSGAPRSICTRISEAALRSQAAFEARLASYLTGRHSGCFLTSSSTYTNYALYVNPTLLPDNHPIHSLRSTHSPQHHKTARASARRAVSAAPSLTHAHSSSASPWNRAVDKGSKVVRASAQAQSSKDGSMTSLHSSRQRSTQIQASRPPRAASACRGPATRVKPIEDGSATSTTSSFPPELPALRRATSQHFAAPTISFAAKSKGGAVELPLRPQRSKPVVANADAYAGPVKGEDNAQSRSRHHSYAAPTTASSARNCTVSKDHAPAPTAAHDPSQQPPVNRKPTANTRSRSQVRNAHERPIKTVTGSESTAHKTDTASKTQSVKSQRSTDTASVIKLKHTTPVKTPETNTTATAAPAEAESSPASVEDQEPPSTTEPVHTADDKAPAAAVEAVTEPAPKIKSPELSSADECPVPPDSTSTVDAFPAMETAPDVTDSPASPKSETVVSAPCSDDKVQLSSTETVNADVVVSKEVLNGVAKQEVAAESQGEQVEADTEVSSSSAAPPPNEALPPAAYSDQPSSEKCEPTPAGQEEAQETATPSSQPSSPPNEVMEDVVPVPTSSPAASKTQSPPPTAAPTPPLPSLVPSGPIAISTTGAGEGGSLPEEEAARYRAKMAEQRRLAKERKAAEEKRKAEEFELARQAAQERAVEEARLAREARAAAEAEAEQRRLQQQQQVAAATTAFAEESVHQNLEERAARDLEKRKELERQRLETLRHEEEERAKRRQKLESIMSRVKGSGQGLSRTNTGNSSTQSLSAMVQSLTADSKARSESPANGTDDVHFTLGGEEASLCAGSMRPYPDGEQQPQVFPSGDHVRQLAFHHDSASAAALYADSAVTNGHSLDADRSNGGGDIGEEPGHKLSSSSFKSPLLQSLLGRGRVAGVVSSGQMGDDTTHRLLSTPRMTSVDPH